MYMRDLTLISVPTSVATHLLQIQFVSKLLLKLPRKSLIELK